MPLSERNCTDHQLLWIWEYFIHILGCNGPSDDLFIFYFVKNIIQIANSCLHEVLSQIYIFPIKHNIVSYKKSQVLYISEAVPLMSQALRHERLVPSWNGNGKEPKEMNWKKIHWKVKVLKSKSIRKLVELERKGSRKKLEIKGAGRKGFGKMEL